MSFETEFEKLHENISLNPARIQRINKAFEDLNEFLLEELKKSPDQLGFKEIFIEAFTQGSYAIKTSIKPADSQEEYDLDIVISLRLRRPDGTYPSAEDVIEWLAEVIRNNDAFKERVSTKADKGKRHLLS